MKLEPKLTSQISNFALSLPLTCPLFLTLLSFLSSCPSPFPLSLSSFTPLHFLLYMSTNNRL